MISFLLTLKRLLSGLFHAFKLKNFQVLFVLIILMLVSGVLFYTKEEGLSIIDALYFCIATLSTVGHPSFEPQTNLGKIFTMVYIIVGTGLFLGLMGYIAYAIIKSNEKEEETESSLQSRFRKRKQK
ncbi:potassium channel family protein [Paenibacillus pini]|uniref:Potassium channel protein n=1 Tax=Paenibacillus pini JCM 16418 TaxID=1236976 RepID=W7YHN1_9BACL|nr:potassium channel family protein [Paenibacillus pini]GAF10425.1 potassium channel protein [Paenibacillus pini JCM 16418]